jgi:hypothetical protein
MLHSKKPESSRMPIQNHVHRLHERGARCYPQRRKKLALRYNGQIVAVEVELGEYAAGKDEL